MQASKKVTKCGAITIPRGIRHETGILPGAPVDVVSDETGIHISKHVPVCRFCGTVDNVKEFKGMEICPGCAVEILEVFE